MQELFAAYNLPYTMLLIVIIIYWITVIIGILDIEIFDFDMDIDSYWSILNFGTVPFSVWISLLILQLFLYSTITNSLLNSVIQPDEYVAIRILGSLLIFVPISFFITKLVTKPLQKLFKTHEAVTHKELIGTTCLITSTSVDMDFGTAEIKTQGSPMLINVIADEKEDIKENDEVIIIDYDENNKVFHVARYLD